MNKYLVLISLFVSTCTFAQKTIDKKLLVGKWVSVQDKKSMIVFTSTKQIDYYEGKKLDEEIYKITYKKRSGCRLTLASGLEYDIYELTAKRLEMTYVGRGNSLIYVRAK
jgi:hypothetical protein